MAAPSGTAISAETSRLAAWIAGALSRPLPAAVEDKARAHILDTLAAIISGSRLRAGELAARYVAALGGHPEATVAGTSMKVAAPWAALANGMAGHADETDDSHLAGRCHPGCAILPAALAVAEARDASGHDLLRAVVLGYEVGVRINLALGFARPDRIRFSTHSIGPAFGAAAAAAVLMGCDERRVRHVLSYAAQQASGLPFWNRDSEHVEKAFDFGGMAARNGVLSATMVASGLTGVDDPFSGTFNALASFGDAPDITRLVADLGDSYEIERASIKKWCVGSPIQAVLDAVEAIQAQGPLAVADIARVLITMPDDRVHIVSNRDMPDVCVQHLAALMLADGGLTFATTHDHARMTDPAVTSVRDRIELFPSPELTVAVPARQAIVEVELRSGERRRHHAKAVRGTPEAPMTLVEVEAKAFDLTQDILGPDRARTLNAVVRDLATLPSVRRLTAVLTA